MDGCPAAIALVGDEPVLVLSEATDPRLAGALARLLANVDAKCAIPSCDFDESANTT